MTAQARKGRGAASSAAQGKDRQDSEQPVSWLELFFDLVFVTAFDRLAQRLLAHPDLPTFGVFALLFVALWWAWLGNTNFAARYGNSCRTYRWGTLAQMLTLAALAVSVRGDLIDVGAFFALGYAANRTILVVMLVLRGREEGRLSPGDRTLALGFTVGAVLWVASAWLGGPAQLLLWGVALALDLACVLYTEARYDRETPHRGHFPERVGLLLIVFLGAVVTELIRGAAEQRLQPADQLPAVLALLSIMAIWRLYFDEAHTLPALLAESSGRAGTLLAWAYTHLPLMLALSVLSVGFGLGIAEEGAEADRHERLLVSTALAVIFVSLTLLRFFSVRPLDAGTVAPAPLRPALSLSSVARLVGAALLLLLIAVPVSTTGYQAACTLITLGVAYLSWLDPVREALNQLEDRLSEDGGAEPSEADRPPDGPSAVDSGKKSEEREAS
ncbi:low temperature requirement protein A [Deinococcus altitudinis]|uniref:low temperature requirement protein A n=1 Tax=Deinococcus altitudinis TaxID=468914 RepID=UPI0038925921